MNVAAACTRLAQNINNLESIGDNLFSNDPLLDLTMTHMHSSSGVYPGTPKIIEHEIQVLVLDQDKYFLNLTASTFELWHYKVTKVRLASNAMRMISAGKKHFDLVIADVDSPDMDGFQFCQEVNKLGILVILTSAKEEPHLTQKALENGAFLYISKPMDLQVVKYLRQIVMKERLKKSKTEVGEEQLVVVRLESGCGLKEKSGTRKMKNKRNAHEGLDAEQPTHDDGDENFFNKKKICTEWTKELHDKFMNAIHQLGEGKCYPKKILEIMKVPGLTRTQVASHLQKCRHDNWRTPDERKNHRRNGRARLTVGESCHNKEKSRVFGSMPRPQRKYGAQIQQINPQLPQTNSVLSGTQSTTASNHENIESPEPKNGTQATASNVGKIGSSDPTYVPQHFTFGHNSECANHSLPAALHLNGQQIVDLELSGRSQRTLWLETDQVWKDYSAVPSSLPKAPSPDLLVGLRDNDTYNMISDYPYHPPQSGINNYRLVETKTIF